MTKTNTLFSTSGPAYPRRPPFFAHQFMRQILDAGMVSTIGEDGFLMLVVIALAEDRLRYTKPPSYWNHNLITMTGWSEDKVHNVRTRLQTAGLLHYERPGRRSQAVYWVIQPPWMELVESLFEVAPQPAIPRTGAGNVAGNPAGNVAGELPGNPAGHSIPLPIPSPPPSCGSEWAAVEAEMIRQGIGEPSLPLRSLREHQVAPDLALGVLRYASEVDAWEPGKVRRRLITLLPGQTPDDVRLWMKPDRPHKLPRAAASAPASASSADDQRRRDARLRQLQLEFEPVLAGETPKSVVRRFELPPAIADRMAAYDSFDMVKRRNESLWLAVLEAVASHLKPELRIN